MFKSHSIPPGDASIDTPPPSTSPHWQPLPIRARKLFLLTHALGFGAAGTVAAIAGGTLLVEVFDQGDVFQAAVAAGVIGLIGLIGGIALGAWLGVKQYKYTSWTLDADGFALRRGRMWQRESRVPASRVQHLDLKHGPLERKYGLATLVIHTAGTKLNTVTVGGLDAGDAERLRDHLAHRIEADVDA